MSSTTIGFRPGAECAGDASARVAAGATDAWWDVRWDRSTAPTFTPCTLAALSLTASFATEPAAALVGFCNITFRTTE
jgi:hypothetical protein